MMWDMTHTKHTNKVGAHGHIKEVLHEHFGTHANGYRAPLGVFTP